MDYRRLLAHFQRGKGLFLPDIRNPGAGMGAKERPERTSDAPSGRPSSLKHRRNGNRAQRYWMSLMSDCLRGRSTRLGTGEPCCISQPEMPVTRT